VKPAIMSKLQPIANAKPPMAIKCTLILMRMVLLSFPRLAWELHTYPKKHSHAQRGNEANIRYLLGKCLGVGYLSELGVVSFFTVSQRGNEGKILQSFITHRGFKRTLYFIYNLLFYRFIGTSWVVSFYSKNIGKVF